VYVLGYSYASTPRIDRRHPHLPSAPSRHPLPRLALCPDGEKRGNFLAQRSRHPSFFVFLILAALASPTDMQMKIDKQTNKQADKPFLRALSRDVRGMSVGAVCDSAAELSVSVSNNEHELLAGEERGCNLRLQRAVAHHYQPELKSSSTYDPSRETNSAGSSRRSSLDRVCMTDPSALLDTATTATVALPVALNGPPRSTKAPANGVAVRRPLPARPAISVANYPSVRLFMCVQCLSAVCCHQLPGRVMPAAT